MISAKKVHRWLALIAILPGLVVLLSGAGLSFAKELDRFIEPGMLSVAASGEIERAKVNSIVVAQMQAQPGWVLQQLRYPLSPYDPIVLAININPESILVYLNPHTGKMLGQRPQSSELAHRLRYLHIALISPSVGHLLGVLVSIVLLLMIALGVYLARVDGRWRLNSWHARLGLCISPILLAIVGSGLLSAFGSNDFGQSVNQVNQAVPETSVSANFFSLQDSEFPAACRQQIISATAIPDGTRVRCEASVIFDLPESATAQDLQLVREGGQLLWNLHSGEWAGLPGRGIWMWSVLAVLYLLYSGLRDWRKQKIKRT